MELREGAAKLVIHLHHFHILLLLHIPYVIPGAGAATPGVGAWSDFSYSKLTALSAGRELLARNGISPSSTNAPSVSHGSSLKVFDSALTLR